MSRKYVGKLALIERRAETVEKRHVSIGIGLDGRGRDRRQRSKWLDVESIPPRQQRALERGCQRFDGQRVAAVLDQEPRTAVAPARPARRPARLEPPVAFLISFAVVDERGRDDR